jgi:hypothetical protein
LKNRLSVQRKANFLSMASVAKAVNGILNAITKVISLIML